MATKSMGENAHEAKADEGKNVGAATRGRQDIKLMGRTVEATRGDRGEKLVRERSTERILAADNRRRQQLRLTEDKVKGGKVDEVNFVPTNISFPVLPNSISPITNNLGHNVDEVKVSPIISEPKATFSVNYQLRTSLALSIIIKI